MTIKGFRRYNIVGENPTFPGFAASYLKINDKVTGYYHILSNIMYLSGWCSVIFVTFPL